MMITKEFNKEFTISENKKVKNVKAENLTTSVTSPLAQSLPADDSIIGRKCPKCGKGIIVKGKTAYGCSNWKECSFRIPFKN